MPYSGGALEQPAAVVEAASLYLTEKAEAEGR